MAITGCDVRDGRTNHPEKAAYSGLLLYRYTPLSQDLLLLVDSPPSVQRWWVATPFYDGLYTCS